MIGFWTVEKAMHKIQGYCMKHFYCSDCKLVKDQKMCFFGYLTPEDWIIPGKDANKFKRKFGNSNSN